MHTQRLRVGHLLLQGRCIVSDKPLVPGLVLAPRTSRFTNAGMTGQPGLDLSQLDPEAADLHLESLRPKNSILPSADTAPDRRSCKAVSRNERTRNKPFAVRSAAVQITAGNPRPSNIISPTTPSGTGLPKPVQQINARIPDRATDREVRPQRVSAHQDDSSINDCCLGGPISIEPAWPAEAPVKLIAEGPPFLIKNQNRFNCGHDEAEALAPAPIDKAVIRTFKKTASTSEVIRRFRGQQRPRPTDSGGMRSPQTEGSNQSRKSGEGRVLVAPDWSRK